MKGKFKNFYYQLSIRYKILWSFYLVFFLAIAASFSVLCYKDFQSSRRENCALYQRMADSARSDIEYLQQDVKDLAVYFTVNAQIQKVMSGKKEDYEADPLFWSDEIPVTLIQNVLMIKSQIKTLILYPENGLRPFYFSRDASVHETSLEALKKTDFYQKVCEARGDLVWYSMDEGENGIFIHNRSNKLIMGKLIMDPAQRKELGIVAIGIDRAPVEEICQMDRLSPEESMVVTDWRGRPLVSVGEVPESVLEQAFGYHYQTEEFQKVDDYRVFCSENEESGLRVYYLSPSRIWVAKLWKMIYTPLVLAAVLIICSWPLSLFLSGLIARPLDCLCRSMDAFSNGDFQQRAEVTSKDEVGRLASSFNNMVEEIQRLINQNYISEIRRQESELNVLQAQIHPHFLYNVLDSLYWQAVEMDNQKMGMEILALSNLFRLMLNKGNEEITIEKEFEMIESYLTIQKMRLGKRLEYDVQVGDEILNYKISKLLIQPFVENAVVHGIENSERNGFVQVRASRKGKFLVFTVEDNGVGMDPEEVARILQGERVESKGDEASHYAIINIQERLKLRYKGRAKLEMQSQKNYRTFVRLVIPVEESESNGDAI